jgi:hypothetical protein
MQTRQHTCAQCLRLFLAIAAAIDLYVCLLCAGAVPTLICSTCMLRCIGPEFAAGRFGLPLLLFSWGTQCGWQNLLPCCTVGYWGPAFVAVMQLSSGRLCILIAAPATCHPGYCRLMAGTPP